MDDDIIYIKESVYSESGVIIPSGLSCLFWAEPDTVLSPSSTSGVIYGLEFQTGANSRVFGLTVSGFDRGVYISNASPHFYNASFKFNERAIHIRLNGARPYFYNCVVANNSGSNYPAFSIESGYPRFINSVFIDNVSSTAAARSKNLCGSIKYNAHTYIYNCIFWNETGGSEEVTYSNSCASSTDSDRSKLTIDSCIIRDHNGDGISDFSASTSSNVSSANPLLFSDYRIGSGSPAINYPNQQTAAPYYDKAANFRYNGVPDLGVYEYTDSGDYESMKTDLNISIDSGQVPVVVTLDASSSGLDYGSSLQAFWDLNGDGTYDSAGVSITQDLPDLMSNLVQLRLFSSQGQEVFQTIDFRDQNANGIPDYWDQENFGSLEVVATDDSDLDGVSNYDEFLANTDPLDNAANGLGLAVHNL